MNPIANGPDPALEPVAARRVDAGIAKARRALDQDALEGRQAVGNVAGSTSAAAPPAPHGKGQLVDRSA